MTWTPTLLALIRSRPDLWHLPVAVAVGLLRTA